MLAQEGLTIKTDEFSAVQKIRTTFFVEKVKDADYNKVKTAHGG